MGIVYRVRTSLCLKDIRPLCDETMSLLVGFLDSLFIHKKISAVCENLQLKS